MTKWFDPFLAPNKMQAQKPKSTQKRTQARQVRAQITLKPFYKESSNFVTTILHFSKIEIRHHSMNNLNVEKLCS